MWRIAEEAILISISPKVCSLHCSRIVRFFLALLNLSQVKAPRRLSSLIIQSSESIWVPCGMAFYIPVCAGGVLAGISPLCFLSVFNYSSERILQCISGHFLFIVWALGILNTALSEVKLHLAPASLYEYSHFISVPLGWLADFDVLARLWLEERIGRKWTRDGEKSAVCFAGPSRADEAFQFLFPIIFNRLNLHVAMATTTDNGAVLRYSYSWWNTSISEWKKERRMWGFVRGYTPGHAVQILYWF